MGWLAVRSVQADDLDAVADMIDDFVRGHPAEHHPRPREQLRAALFGDRAVAELVVAEIRGRAVGMVQWWRIYDLFWAMYGARAEWLYVRPEVRGLGIAAALIAEVCARARAVGGEFLLGAGSAQVATFYERIAIGSVNRECNVSAEAFQIMAGLARRPLRELVAGLPRPELNFARPRS